jgi:putative transposase
LVSPLKRTWAPRGQTPTVRTSVEHNARLNWIGALCLTAGQRKLRLHLQSHRRSIRGEEVVRFLRHLLRHIPGAIVLVWDKHPIHRRCKVKEFLAQHVRLQVYEFPTSAPELNPTEFAWVQMSEATAGTAPHNAAELRVNVMRGVTRLRRSKRRLWACIYGSDLPWER